MSTYVMSDIHGMYDDYRKLLEIIDFSDEDLLYVDGDVIDRGEDGIKVLRHMAMESNILPVLGNHEYMAARCLRFLLREVTDESIDELKSDFLEGLLQWREVGGNKTIEGFSGLSGEEKEGVPDYLSEFTPYEKVCVNGRSFLIVHAGLHNFSEDRDIDDYRLDELIYHTPDYSRVYFKDRFLVTGHLPTRGIPGAEPDRVYMKNNHIAIDCGASFGGRLAAVRLDDLRVFYSDD